MPRLVPGPVHGVRGLEVVNGVAILECAQATLEIAIFDSGIQTIPAGTLAIRR